MAASAVDSGNSSTSPLAASATFTGTGKDVLAVDSVSIALFTDRAGSLFVEFSSDNSNWDISTEYTITAGQHLAFTREPLAQYFRLRVVNGANAQTVLRLTTLLQHRAEDRANGMYRSVDLGSTGEAICGAGCVHSLFLANMAAASAAHFRVYVQPLIPNPAADTPVLNFALPQATSMQVALPKGIPVTGTDFCWIRVTTTAGDTDTTAPVATECQVSALYTQDN